MEEDKMCTRKICQKLIETHKDRVTPKDESYLTQAQRNIFQAVTDLVRTSRSPILRYRDIKNKYKGGLLPSDFCYNLVNIGQDHEVKFLRYLGRGMYEFVNFNWGTAGNIEITWSPTGSDDLKGRTFKVGYYRNGNYEWDFTELKKFL
jgi:hypothetical protein